MLRIVVAVLLFIFAGGVQAENKPYYYTVEIGFRAVGGDYSGKAFIYQVTVRPGMSSGHEDLAKKFLAWSKKRLEQELPHMKLSGCSQELKDAFWKILSDELKYWQGLSVSTACRQSGLSSNTVF